MEEATRLLGVPEPEARELADEGGRVPLEAVRNRIGKFPGSFETLGRLHKRRRVNVRSLSLTL